MKAESRAQLEAVANGSSLSEALWRPILSDVLADLEEHLGEGFRVDPSPELHGTSCGLWLWSKAPSSGHSERAWTAHLAVGPATRDRLLSITLTQAYFDSGTQQRIHTPEGSIVVHGLDVGAGRAEPRWQSYGWQSDSYDQWIDMPFPDAT